jgi:hypothetical protein
MIKFTLTIWVCSFLSSPSVCMPPLQVPALYDTWYECTRAAHKESLQLISTLGYKLVNDNQLATRYVCRADSSI